MGAPAFFWPALLLYPSFLRDLLPQERPVTWVNLDRKAERKLANDIPELFLSRFSQRPLIIDEAHKAPDLFDEIKAEVDLQRMPGGFILSGSVYFSKKIGIQESLTSRTSLIRMDTLTLSETISGKLFGLKELQQYFRKGGMPGACFVRNEEEFSDYWDQWIETTCHRDLKIFSQGRLSGDLAEEILEACAKLEFPTLASLAKSTGVDMRRVRIHAEALVDLFVLRKVPPSTQGIGKDMYLPFDCGLAHRFGAAERRLWQVGFQGQTVNSALIAGQKMKPPRYYLTARHSFIDFELEGKSLHLYCDKPNPTRSELMTAEAARKANPGKIIYIHCATESFEHIKQDGITWVSWVHGWKGVR